MRRVFKNLKIATQRRKQLRLLALGAFGIKKVSDRSIVKQCFDALRLNKEQEVYTMMRTKLHEDTGPGITKLKSEIDRAEKKGDLSMRMRCMQALMNPCGR